MKKIMVRLTSYDCMFHCGDIEACHILGNGRHISGMKGSIHCRKRNDIIDDDPRTRNYIGRMTSDDDDEEEESIDGI
jgi:hypothetical protein